MPNIQIEKDFVMVIGAGRENGGNYFYTQIYLNLFKKMNVFMFDF